MGGWHTRTHCCPESGQSFGGEPPTFSFRLVYLQLDLSRIQAGEEGGMGERGGMRADGKGRDGNGGMEGRER